MRGSAFNSLSRFPPKSKPVSGHPIPDFYEQNETHVIGPFDPRLKLGQTEVNLNTEHDRPVLLPALTRRGLGARSQILHLRKRTYLAHA